MKIVICGSMAFAKAMIEAKDKLKQHGHTVVLPENIEIHAAGGLTSKEDKAEKIERDLIRGYFEEIRAGDAILVINNDKNGIDHYIGGNSLIEIAFAHVLDKRIFLLNPIPVMSYTNEIEAMQPIVLHGDLNSLS